ncbi:MAG TPA: phytanoyl-CoA dioxygenase family protein [Acidimicrobiales bacterium]|nr:phytanoyl-CoA dioxygenase family protein [Acidimicrobiales bacterium]
MSGITQSPPSPASLVTDADIAFYREHGYWVSPPFIPDEPLDIAEQGMYRLYADDVDHLLDWDRRSDLDSFPPGRYSHWGWRPSHGDVMRKNDYSSLRVTNLAQLVRFPLIAACAARLSGNDELRLWHDQLLYKPVDTGRNQANVQWHTDRFYWLTCSSEDMFTAWIPFADVSQENGAMSVVDGSHRWSDELDIDWQNAPFSVIGDVLSARGAELVSVSLKRGQVSFHHCKTIHGSGPNRSREPRRSLVVHYQPGSNHYLVERHRRHPNDDLVRRTEEGDPDYSDPDVCPELYPLDA